MKLFILVSIAILSLIGIVGVHESFATEPCDLHPIVHWDSYDDIYTGKVVSITNQTSDARIDFELEHLLKGNPQTTWYKNVPFETSQVDWGVPDYGADHYTLGSEIFYIENYNYNGSRNSGGYCGIGVSETSHPIFQAFFEYYEKLYGKSVPTYIENNNQEPFVTESILLYSSKLNDNYADETSAPGVIIEYDQEVTLSKIPKLGETATISVIINLKPEFSQLQGNSTQKITLENGFSFVNIDESLLTLNPKTNLLSYSESLPVVMNVPTVFEFEITPTKVGTWSVYVDGGNYKHRPSFDFIVNDNETILDGKSSYKSGLVVENVTSKNTPLTPSESVSSPISGEMSLSNIPKLGETAQLTITKHIVTRSYGYPTTGIGLVIPPGFELIDAGNLIFNEENTELLQRDKAYENVQVFSKEIPVSDSDEIQTMTSVVTIKAVQTGNWTLYATSSLNVVVGEDESFLVDYFQSSSVPYSSTEPEPPPKLINIHPSPKKQLASGVTPENVICREGLNPYVFGHQNRQTTTICITHETMNKLEERNHFEYVYLQNSGCIDPLFIEQLKSGQIAWDKMTQVDYDIIASCESKNFVKNNLDEQYSIVGDMVYRFVSSEHMLPPNILQTVDLTLKDNTKQSTEDNERYRLWISVSKINEVKSWKFKPAEIWNNEKGWQETQTPLKDTNLEINVENEK